jgi:hypothetical protein
VRGRGPLAIRSRAPPPVRDGAGNERTSGAVESAGGDALVEGTAGDRWRLEGPATSGVSSELGRSQCSSVICETTLSRRQRGRGDCAWGPLRDGAVGCALPALGRSVCHTCPTLGRPRPILVHSKTQGSAQYEKAASICQTRKERIAILLALSSRYLASVVSTCT